jgi:hypothetical protein
MLFFAFFCVALRMNYAALLVRVQYILHNFCHVMLLGVASQPNVVVFTGENAQAGVRSMCASPVSKKR